jgi:hypothetical protein
MMMMMTTTTMVMMMMMMMVVSKKTKLPKGNHRVDRDRSRQIPGYSKRMVLGTMPSWVLAVLSHLIATKKISMPFPRSECSSPFPSQSQRPITCLKVWRDGICGDTLCTKHRV